MKRYILAALILGLAVSCGYCQDDQAQAPAAETSVMPVPPAAEKTVQPQEISIYGEVKAVNPAANSMTVQYYDYDSDEEKSIAITVDNNTKMENAASINDIKQGNWADVMYAVSAGNNLARSVIVEKEEEAPVEMPKVEETPQAAPVQ
ncbi:MAG: hypothetical protein PHX20_05110 [Candidatus Omnitrophica bacterium]|nr:hypothetical protein [Candidatus Omnitrophota bacterium]MDD5436903.1 hypothetical protein [Candidatus Omnitrophota bacterium]